ncbi:PotD/PotF family extracellular solute-binding protein [Herbiconiux sp. L3-i23]|uniref:ABC transporter substrate-binding protein n=1 Tax=Herbiconiux sp. L3-i23 TaxID=2905871 RepID=UPI00204CC6EE|nr:spermidine/putrescine ABC transporter substrate-binding protein [Herbiconiux sp. L3-i23]BDI22034.1 polyamine-binding lipoprotein [Herbiconiux sp. L3-i23]
MSPRRELPADPVVRQLIQQARSWQLGRRGFLTGAGASAAALALAACAPTSTEPPAAAEDESATDKTLNWANWPAYIDEDDAGDYPTLVAFEEQTGIKVNYLVDVDDNNTYYAKVRDQLALGQDIGADTVCLTEWMVARLVRFGYVQDLDESKIPNKKNLTPSLADPDFDPGRAKSLPWQGGFGGICWNKEVFPDGLRSVSDLWQPELKGRVGVLSEMRDTLGLIMLENGVDITGDWGSPEFQEAMDLFSEKVDSGQIAAVKGNSYLEDLASGNTLAAICWSGDITVLNAESGDKWEFAIPEAGGTFWNDTFVVPIGSPRKANAEELINYYYEPEVAAQVAAWVNYVTPVVGAKEAMEVIDPELAENQLIFPDDDTLATVHPFRTLTAQEETEFQAEFQKVLLG